MNGAHQHEARHAPEPGGLAGRQRALTLALVLTASYMLAEVIGGLLTGSLTLLADAGHMLADVAGLSMGLVATWFARRPATAARTYGFHRAEILAAVANGLLLFLVAGYILFEAWQRFQEPVEIQALAVLGIGAGGLIVNLIGLRLLHGLSGESLNVRGAYLELLADLLGSVAVLLSAGIVVLTGWRQIDPLLSVAIALFILPRAWSLLRSGLEVLLEATPRGIDPSEIGAAARALPGVRGVHDLHVWSIASGFVALSAHVEAEGRRSSDVLHDVQVLLKQRFNIDHTTLQVESADHADDGACCVADPRCLVPGEPLPPLPGRRGA